MSSSSSSSSSSESVEAMKSRVRLTDIKPENVKTMQNKQSMEEFMQGFTIAIQELTEDTIVFDMAGCDAAFANALRRILLDEVPTMAIEHVLMNNNTSVIQDEVLAHRLGLIPIHADPSVFEFEKDSFSDLSSFDQPKPDQTPGEDPRKTIKFRLNVTCTHKTQQEKVAEEENEDGDGSPYKNHKVYSGDLEWIPLGDQAEEFVGEEAFRPVHDDILLAELRPGQSLEMDLLVKKGVGKEHAKWSPVGTASYRLQPEILVAEGVEDEHASHLAELCPRNVFDIEDLGNGHQGITVARPRECTMCRECVRDPNDARVVTLQRVKDHFIFSVESVGQIPPEKLVKTALEILQEKCQEVTRQLVSIS